MTIRYFSTFTGVGGLEHGLPKNSVCVGISEINKNSEAIYYHNHDKSIRNYGDITKINVKLLPDFDLLVGGFPCQSFSMAGDRKGFTDRRGKMIFYLYDILKYKRPKYAVFENVTGLKNHNNGKTYRDVFRLLMYAGYHVRCLELNSAFYGSAQSRERVFFLLSRDHDFEAKIPVKTDDTKRFRDVRDHKGPHVMLKMTPNAKKRLQNSMDMSRNTLFKYELIGGYNRVGTLLTGGDVYKKICQENGKWRLLTITEMERLQGFPDGYTAAKGMSLNKRVFAMGNAVNCYTSKYLFNDYLKGLWQLN